MRSPPSTPRPAPRAEPGRRRPVAGPAIPPSPTGPPAVATLVLLSLLIVLLLAAAPPARAQETITVTGCATILEPGTYVLGGDIDATNSEAGFGGACLTVLSRDVVLDGDGHVVRTTDDAVPGGVLVHNVTKVTVRDLDVEGFSDEGVHVDAAGDVAVIGVRVADAGTGLRITQSLGTVLRDIALDGNGDGLVAGADADVDARRVTASSSSAWDVVLDAAGSASFTDLRVGASLLDLRGQDVRLRPASGVDGPSLPHRALGRFVETEAVGGSSSAWLNASIAYSSSEVEAYQEATLAWWRLDGSTWSKVQGWNVVDTSARRVRANVTSFSVLGPAVREDVDPPETTVTGGEPPLDGGGWFRSDVTLGFPATDDYSGVARTDVRLDGGDWRTLSDGTLSFSPETDEGVHEVAYRSVDVAGNVEEPKDLFVRLDATRPATTHRVDGRPLLDGSFAGPVTVALSASDAHSGVVLTEFSLDGGPWTPYVEPVAVEEPGDHEVAYRSVDVAGNDEPVQTVALTVRDASGGTGSADGDGSDGGGDDAGPAAAGGSDGGPRLRILIERGATAAGGTAGSGGGGGGGAGGTLGGSDLWSPSPLRARIEVLDVPDPANLTLVAVGPDGAVVVLGRGASATWDTSGHDNGWYRIEARRVGGLGPDGGTDGDGGGDFGVAGHAAAGDGARAASHGDDVGGVTVASEALLVENPRAGAVPATLAVAAGVLFAWAAHAVTAGTGRLADLVSYLVKVVRRALGIEYRERTKARTTLRTEHLREAIAAAVAAAVFALSATYAGLFPIDVDAFLAALPVFGGAAVVFSAFWYGGEWLLSRASGEEPMYRLLGSGLASITVSTLLLRSPFGVPGYVDKGQPTPLDGSDLEREQAVKTLLDFGMIAAAGLVFVASMWLWRFDFGETGVLLVVMALATGAVPVKPLPNHRVWRWNRGVGAAVLVVGVALYLAFQLALLPHLVVLGLGLAGVAGAVAYLHWYVEARWVPWIDARPEDVGSDEAMGWVSGAASDGTFDGDPDAVEEE